MEEIYLYFYCSRESPCADPRMRGEMLGYDLWLDITTINNISYMYFVSLIHYKSLHWIDSIISGGTSQSALITETNTPQTCLQRSHRESISSLLDVKHRKNYKHRPVSLFSSSWSLEKCDRRRRKWLVFTPLPSLFSYASPSWLSTGPIFKHMFFISDISLRHVFCVYISTIYCSFQNH